MIDMHKIFQINKNWEEKLIGKTWAMYENMNKDNKSIENSS